MTKRTLFACRCAKYALHGILALLCSLAQAQNYPSRSVRIVVPFPAGGGADFMARAVGQKLGDALGQTFVIDNRTGASGAIGSEMVAKALPLAMIDLVAGNTTLVFDSIPSAMPHIRSGRVLAVGSLQRTSAAPEVPTVAELGLPGYEIGSWYGLFAPSATPREIVQRLATETARAVNASDVRTRFLSLGADPIGLSADDSTALLAREIERWAKVARLAQVKAE